MKHPWSRDGYDTCHFVNNPLVSDPAFALLRHDPHGQLRSTIVFTCSAHVCRSLYNILLHQRCSRRDSTSLTRRVRIPFLATRFRSRWLPEQTKVTEGERPRPTLPCRQTKPNATKNPALIGIPTGSRLSSGIALAVESTGARSKIISLIGPTMA